MIGLKENLVTASHLARKAYLYVRQSTLRQVVMNTESTQRQYELKRRAIALGWSEDRVEVIDDDLGRSGSSAAEREGFQRLVAEVGMGRAGLVMGLEVSRLARNSSDWHRLLEISALSDTLILDEDGLYDPRSFNDHLVLGLKGTMSEAELHQIRARLMGGMLGKARRGELRLRLPVGFVYDARGAVVLDPDREVRESVRLLFAEFRRTGSAHGAARSFRERGLLFPTRRHTGPEKGELRWAPLRAGRVFAILANPRYAGAYAYGRRQGRRTPSGAVVVRAVPREEWKVLIPDAHEGYLSFADFEENQRRVQGNALGERKYPPREGPALLQGLAVCGRCGRKMTVRYQTYRGETRPVYVCPGNGPDGDRPSCQSLIGVAVDGAVGDLLVEVVTPLALSVTLAVEEELRERVEEADALRRKRVERADYEAELARRRFARVDPDHRLVADSLEADWNEKLRELRTCREEYERRREEDRRVLSEEARAQILGLATDFPRVWRSPETPARERKRIVRLLIEDVTLVKGEQVDLHVRFRGGATRSLTVPRPRLPWEDRRVDPEVVREIDRLLGDHTHAEVAELLNARGYVSGTGQAFHADRVGKIVRAYRLKTRYARLREAGLLTLKEVAKKLGVCRATVKLRRAQGRLGLRAVRLDDVGRYLYEEPDGTPPEAGHLSTRAEEV
ncbi:MAG: recombinase family protein [Candidatus Latescibacteria bacterium]|nr:recombinase family protein [Candidatus Latescibacterota bacterium]